LAGHVGRPGKYGLIYPELDSCFLESFAQQASAHNESPFEITPEACLSAFHQGKPFLIKTINFGLQKNFKSPMN